MKFLFASDSFKGTLSSARIAELLTTAAKESFPDCTCTSIETADGGEGTTDAVLSAVQGQRIPLVVCGPLWKKTDCFYGKLDEERAVMEMAAASGLPLLTEPERDPEKTTTYGTGEMILDALDRGFRDISIAIGGSATNDGGMGCMCALGVRFLDENGEILQGCGENLGKISEIDVSGLDSRVAKTKFTVMCDVNNPLCGENGATYTFGPQKGGTPESLARLEEGMLHYRDVLLREFGVDVNEIPGAGAAGGLGAALVVFLNAVQGLKRFWIWLILTAGFRVYLLWLQEKGAQTGSLRLERYCMVSGCTAKSTAFRQWPLLAPWDRVQKESTIQESIRF